MLSHLGEVIILTEIITAPLPFNFYMHRQTKMVKYTADWWSKWALVPWAVSCPLQSPPGPAGGGYGHPLVCHGRQSSNWNRNKLLLASSYNQKSYLCSLLIRDVTVSISTCLILSSLFLFCISAGLFPSTSPQTYK